MRFFVIIFQSFYWFHGINSTKSIKNSIQSQLESSCPAHSYSGVTWSSNKADPDDSDDAIYSDPMCLDENKFTISRECRDGEWSPTLPPDCTYHQKSAEKRIPEGFVEVSHLSNNVIYETKPKPWNNSCAQFHYSGPITDYFGHLPTSSEFFWLPVKRSRSYYPFLQTTGPDFGEEAVDFNDLVEAEECLISNFDGSIIKSANCKDHYPEICIHDQALANLMTGFCSSAELTTRYFTTEKCFKMVPNENPINCDNYFKVTSWHDVEILKEISKWTDSDYLRIQIDPFEGDEKFYFEKWQNNIDNIQFVNWEGLIPEGGPSSAYVLAGENGRWILADPYGRTVCERSVEIKVPQLILAYNYIATRLELTVLNYDFTDSTPKCYTTFKESLLAQIIVDGPMSTNAFQIPDLNENGIQNPVDMFITELIYNIEFNNVFPGEYWCSVQSLPGYHILNSNVVVIEGSIEGQVVFGLNVNSSFFCNQQNCLTAEPIRNLELSSTVLKTKLQELYPSIDIVDVRAMEILDVTFEEVEILFHVTITLNEDLIPEFLDPFQFIVNDDIHFRTKMNFIHFVINDLTPVYVIPTSKLYHTFYCVSEIEDNPSVLRLISARIGEKAVIPKLCLNDDLVLAYWKCVGQFPFGVRWLSTKINYCRIRNIPPHTKELFNLVTQSYLTLENMNQIKEITSEESLNPTDLFLVGISFKKFHKTGLEQIQSREDLQVIHNIMNNVLEVSKGVAQLGNIHLNASNIILSSYEDIFSYIATNSDLIIDENFYESGVTEFNSSNIFTFIINPEVQNISGVAVFRRDGHGSNYKYKDNDFNLTEVDIRYLIANESISDLLENDLLESAMIFPEDLLNSITTDQQVLTESSTETPFRIIMSIMKNDVLFQPTVTDISEVPVGRVLMASIPWFDANLKSLFLYFLKIDRNLTSEDEYKCGFWNFHSGSGNESEWSEEGCFFIGIYRNTTNPIAVCGCTHLTSFAFLMTGGKDFADFEKQYHHMRVLDLITIIGCFLSLAGIIMIWITAGMFRSWRKKKGTKILLHLSLGIASQNVLILIPNFKDIGISQKLPCLIFGVSLHYSVLVVFAWMLITAYFQYLRFVTVFKSTTTRILMKSCIVGYIVPLLPIAVILSINIDLYIPNQFTADSALCYPQARAFLYGLILPVCLIMIINLFVFGMIVNNLFLRPKTTRIRNNSIQIKMDQLRVVIFLFFLLGFNWIFGIFINLEWNSLVLSYLFCVTTSLQGLTLFVYFIMLDPNTRSLWLNIRKYKKFERSK